MSAEERVEELKALPGVGPSTAGKLARAGYTLFKLANADTLKVAEVLGCSKKQAAELVDKAKAHLKEGKNLPTALTARDYLEEVAGRTVWFSSGSRVLDRMLGGGYRSSSLVGLSGPFSVGKTQSIMTAIVDCVSKGKYALLVETELDTFDPNRLTEIAKARNKPFELEKVLVVDAHKVTDVSRQFYAYNILYDAAKEQGLDVGVIAVDSFTGLFQRKYRGRETLGDRKRELARHLSFLEDMAKDFNAVVMLACQVISIPVSPEESRGQMDTALVHSITGSNYIPWGGNTLLHTLGTWLGFEWTRTPNVYRATLYDSSRCPRATCYFTITSKGIDDVPPSLLQKRKK